MPLRSRSVPGRRIHQEPPARSRSLNPQAGPGNQAQLDLSGLLQAPQDGIDWDVTDNEEEDLMAYIDHIEQLVEQEGQQQQGEDPLQDFFDAIPMEYSVEGDQQTVVQQMTAQHQEGGDTPTVKREF
jgi:hypothetical protein